jgi:hypothetical protein
MSTHQRAVSPVLQDSIRVFTGEAGHSREVALCDLLPDQDAPAADVVAECCRKVEQDARHAALQREEGRCRQCGVGLAQSARQQHHDMAAELRVGSGESFEGGTADEAQF